MIISLLMQKRVVYEDKEFYKKVAKKLEEFNRLIKGHKKLLQAIAEL